MIWVCFAIYAVLEFGESIGKLPPSANCQIVTATVNNDGWDELIFHYFWVVARTEKVNKSQRQIWPPTIDHWLYCQIPDFRQSRWNWGRDRQMSWCWLNKGQLRWEYANSGNSFLPSVFPSFLCYKLFGADAVKWGERLGATTQGCCIYQAGKKCIINGNANCKVNKW